MRLEGSGCSPRRLPNLVNTGLRADVRQKRELARVEAKRLISAAVCSIRQAQQCDDRSSLGSTIALLHHWESVLNVAYSIYTRA